MNEAVEIRRATRRDCAELCRTHVSSIRGLCVEHYSEAEIDAWSGGRTPELYGKLIAEKHVVVAQDRTEVVGFGTLDCNTGVIMQLYVRPDFAGKGIGRRILSELLSEATRQPLNEVRCVSSLNAKEFYIRSGFHPGAKRRQRLRSGAEIDCIPMSKIIGQERVEKPTNSTTSSPEAAGPERE